MRRKGEILQRLNLPALSPPPSCAVNVKWAAGSGVWLVAGQVASNCIVRPGRGSLESIASFRCGDFSTPVPTYPIAVQP
jgi:hypothetical protein